jgi:tetratricopeptide (TPR) repeat protein
MSESKEKTRRAKKNLLIKIQSMVLRGASLDLQGKSGRPYYEKALKETNGFLRLSNYKRDTDVLILKGNVLETLGRHSRAARVYEKVLTIEPRNARAHIDLGECFQWVGNYRKAMAYYDKALRLLCSQQTLRRSREDLKDIEQAYRNKIELLVKRGKKNTALEVIDKSLRQVRGSTVLKEMKRGLSTAGPGKTEGSRRP